MTRDAKSLVTTVKERCRMCYTCVRECPAKAIQVLDSQASVVSHRCIGCGNCIRVCSQNAKIVESSLPQVRELLKTDEPVVAIVAPSFPAEFSDISVGKFVGMIRAVGFSHVFEVSFGADMVAREYLKVLNENPDKSYIATTCPAIVSYVQKYHPDLVKDLMPVVSPMVATARVARQLVEKPCKVIFIGPCLAKKEEARQSEVETDVDDVLTFPELRKLLESECSQPEKIEPEKFDQPMGAMGGLFPIARGFLQTANLKEDLLTSEIVAADGNPEFIAAIEEFRKPDTGLRLLELLSCNGCIMGIGYTEDEPQLVRRRKVAEYVASQTQVTTPEEFEAIIEQFKSIPLDRGFHADDQQFELPSPDVLMKILAAMGKEFPEDELNCGACGYPTCREHAAAIFQGLAEPEMCLPYTIEHLRDVVVQLRDRQEDLLHVQEALTHSEKLASMGQMAAGIAHEINNPLGIVILYAQLLLEQLPDELANRKDLEIIAEQADRCKKIVSGLLNFARRNRVVREQVDMNQLIADAITSVATPSNITITFEKPENSVSAQIDRTQILQVLSNLIGNAVDAMPQGGEILVTVEAGAGEVVMTVTDEGNGISTENQASIFEPFYTTKPAGKGTGLGLSVVHGIIKMHNGQIDVTSPVASDTERPGARFTVTIPDSEMA